MNRLIVVLFVVLFGVVAIIICITVNYMCFRFVVWFVDFGDFLSRYPPQTLVTVCRLFVVVAVDWLVSVEFADGYDAFVVCRPH